MESIDKKMYVAPSVTEIVNMEDELMQNVSGTATGEDPEFTEDAKSLSRSLYELIYDK